MPEEPADRDRSDSKAPPGTSPNAALALWLTDLWKDEDIEWIKRSDDGGWHGWKMWRRKPDPTGDTKPPPAE